MADKPRWRQSPWKPDPKFDELFAGSSGNVVNGLGEHQRCKPRQIFWLRQSEKGPLPKLQDTVVNSLNSVPELANEWINADRGPPDIDEPADVTVKQSTAAWTRALKEFALNHEADQIGVAEMDPNWIYEGFESDFPRVAVIVVAMDHSRSAELPPSRQHPEWAQEVFVQYNRATRAARYLAQWIKSKGYRARPHGGPWVGRLNMIPAAIAAGLGELGKHGSIINREFGSSCRLAAVETDMPMDPDHPVRFGADEFCLRCQVCTNHCPPQAIHSDKQLIRGDKKFYVDFDKCIGYFNETFGCAICISVCPWSSPGRSVKFAETWAKRVKPDS